MANTILVTGATGTVGSHLVKALAEKPGVAVRAGVHSAAKAAALKSSTVTPVDLDYTRPETLAAAVQGVDRVFVLTPFHPEQVALGKALVDAAKAAGVKHFVKLSAMGCEIEPGIQLGRWHRAVEKLIEATGVPYTFLRPNNFMENFIGYYPPGPDGNIYLPWGTAAVSFIAANDIAHVAAAALTNDTGLHGGKAYTLTGPEALTVAQVAAILGEVSGRKVAYVDVPEDAARSAMAGMGMPEFAVNAMMELHAIDKAGYAAAVTPDVERALGRPAQRFADWARANAGAWRAKG